MVEQSTRDRVDEYWSSTLATSVAELHAPGVRVRANPPNRQSWRGIYVLAFGGATIFVPDDHLAKVSAAVGGRAAEEVVEATTWQGVLGDSAQTIVGPVRHYYL